MRALGDLAVQDVNSRRSPASDFTDVSSLEENCAEAFTGEGPHLSDKAPLLIEKRSLDLQICLFPIGKPTVQATVYRGELTSDGQLPIPVVVKIYSGKSGTANAEIETAEKLTNLPSLIEFIGVVTIECNKLKIYCHGYVSRPGIIYAFIPGKSVKDLHSERRTPWKNAFGNQKADTSDFAGWASCVTYQMVLAHLQTLSKGLMNTDAHSDNFLVDESHKFTLGGSECGFVKMIDLGIMRQKKDADIPAALTSVLFETDKYSAISAFEMFFVENKHRTLQMSRELLDLIAKISKLDTRIEESFSEMLKIRIRAIKKLPEKWPETALDTAKQKDLDNFWLYKLYEAITAGK